MLRPLRQAQGRPFDRLRTGFVLAAAAALVLTAGACATPSAEKSAAGGAQNPTPRIRAPRTRRPRATNPPGGSGCRNTTANPRRSPGSMAIYGPARACWAATNTASSCIVRAKATRRTPTSPPRSSADPGSSPGLTPDRGPVQAGVASRRKFRARMATSGPSFSWRRASRFESPLRWRYDPTNCSLVPRRPGKYQKKNLLVNQYPLKKKWPLIRQIRSHIRKE